MAGAGSRRRVRWWTALAGVGVWLTLAGCAAGAKPRTYMNGINHCYLCAVRVARANGYQIREQDFHVGNGTLVAARSTPDPKETKISRGWFRRLRESLWNMWERHEFEFWDEETASGRARTEQRVTAKFKAKSASAFSWLGVGKRDRTTVKVAVDDTDYGREDWMIRRRDALPDVRERVYRGLADCLGLAAPSLYVTRPAEPPPAPPPVATQLPAAALVTSTAPAEAVAATPVSATLVAEAAAPAPAVVPVPRSVQPPAEAVTRLLKGKEAYDSGRFADAIPLLEQAAAGDPESAETLVYLAASYYQLKRLDEAIAAYERYLVLAPNDLASKDFLAEIRAEKAAGKTP